MEYSTAKEVPKTGQGQRSESGEGCCVRLLAIPEYVLLDLVIAECYAIAGNSGSLTGQSGSGVPKLLRLRKNDTQASAAEI